MYSAVSSSGTNGGWRPATSAAAQPNIRSAAGFQTVTARSAPTAMMASAAHSMTARAAASGAGRPGPAFLRANPRLSPTGSWSRTCGEQQSAKPGTGRRGRASNRA